MYGNNLRRDRHAVRPSPIFLLILAVAVLGGFLAATGEDQGFAQGTAVQRLGVFLLIVAGWVVTLCVHEFCHAYAAYRGGDRSVESAGYLTLNPLKYAHPVLSIVLPLAFIALGGLGLPGGAVYLHRHAMRSKWAQSMAAAAGPLSNVAFAAVILILVNRQSPEDQITPLWSGLAFLGFLQVSAAVLNLLPVPGLDGYAIIEPHLDPELARQAEWLKPWGMLIVIVLLTLDRLNRFFFDFVGWFYDLSGGAPRALSDRFEFSLNSGEPDQDQLGRTWRPTSPSHRQARTPDLPTVSVVRIRLVDEPRNRLQPCPQLP